MTGKKTSTATPDRSIRERRRGIDFRVHPRVLEAGMALSISRWYILRPVARNSQGERQECYTKATDCQSDGRMSVTEMDGRRTSRAATRLWLRSRDLARITTPTTVITMFSV
jgi:hypothetical protein